MPAYRFEALDVAGRSNTGLLEADNAKAALVSRGLVEITRLGVAMGADAATFQGLAGLGEVEVGSHWLGRARRPCGDEPRAISFGGGDVHDDGDVPQSRRPR